MATAHPAKTRKAAETARSTSSCRPPTPRRMRRSMYATARIPWRPSLLALDSRPPRGARPAPPALPPVRGTQKSAESATSVRHNVKCRQKRQPRKTENPSETARSTPATAAPTAGFAAALSPRTSPFAAHRKSRQKRQHRAVSPLPAGGAAPPASGGLPGVSNPPPRARTRPPITEDQPESPCFQAGDGWLPLRRRMSSPHCRFCPLARERICRHFAPHQSHNGVCRFRSKSFLRGKAST